VLAMRVSRTCSGRLSSHVNADIRAAAIGNGMRRHAACNTQQRTPWAACQYGLPLEPPGRSHSATWDKTLVRLALESVAPPDQVAGQSPPLVIATGCLSETSKTEALASSTQATRFRCPFRPATLSADFHFLLADSRRIIFCNKESSFIFAQVAWCPPSGLKAIPAALDFTQPTVAFPDEEGDLPSQFFA
jgi:hypothetical protein